MSTPGSPGWSAAIGPGPLGATPRQPTEDRQEVGEQRLLRRMPTAAEAPDALDGREGEADQVAQPVGIVTSPSRNLPKLSQYRRADEAPLAVSQ